MSLKDYVEVGRLGFGRWTAGRKEDGQKTRGRIIKWRSQDKGNTMHALSEREVLRKRKKKKSRWWHRRMR